MPGGPRRTGGPGYPPRAMWRAYLCKFVLKIRYNVELLEWLRDSPRLRGICGFTGAILSESAFSRFVSRLAGRQNFPENCFAEVTSQLRGLLLTGKPRSGRPEEPPPPLGEVVAVDSTAVASYGNLNRKRVSGPDAHWGLKHSARTKDGKQEWNWGYKLHLIAGASHGLPLNFTVTPANKSASLKHSRGLEGHTARGLRKVTLQAIMSLLTCQATALARLPGRRPRQYAPDAGQGRLNQPDANASASRM